MLQSDISNENQCVHQKIFSPGAVIFFEGDGEDAAYVVRSGRVEISREINGRKVVLNEVGENGLFGEVALGHDDTRMATATALEKTICAVIPKRFFDEQLDEANVFFRTFIGLLGENIRNMSSFLERELTQGDKLADFPIEVATAVGSESNETINRISKAS